MPSRLFTLRNLLLVLAVWIVVAVIVIAVRAPYVARHRLECVRYVILLVNQHVKDQGGQWPKSWEAVERVRPPSGAPDRPCEWPEVRQNVEVKFGVDPAALAKQDPETFQAIQPRGNCGDYTEDVEMLLAAIRSARKAKEAEKGDEGKEGEVSPSEASGP